MEPAPSRYTQADQPDRPLKDGIGQLIKTNNLPLTLAVKARSQYGQAMSTTYAATWTLGQV